MSETLPPVVPQGALRHLDEQLWRPYLATGAVEVVTTGPRAGWTDAETYLALPSVASATMLVPATTTAALRGALGNYRRLRRPLPALQRTLLAAGAGAGVPLPFPTVRVQVRDDSAATRPPLPLEHLSRELDVPLLAAIGVRTGANRKATLQLVDHAGRPRGFAKIAWDDVSAASVRGEADALASTPGGGPAQAPALLARGEMQGRPYLVTAPIPPDAARLRSHAMPSPQQYFALCPIVRHAPWEQTGQLRDVRRRLGLQVPGPEAAEVVARSAELLDLVAASPGDVPVGERWHGDFTPWNCASDSAGTLWCWDWESSEADAASGMDALHWQIGVRTERGRTLDAAMLLEVHRAAEPMLVAAGVAPPSRAVVTALYVATIAERACALAAGVGGWEPDWLTPAQLLELLATARGLLTAPA